MPSDLTYSTLQQAGIGAYFRPREVARLGITHYQIQRMVAEGTVEAYGHGLYRLAEVEATELETLAMIAAAVPNAIICLLSALRVHEIGSQAPFSVWLAIDRKARKPRQLPSSTHIVRFSGQMLTYGVVETTMLGVSTRITTPARTVVDCFRYRNKIGLDIAMEALHDAVRSRKTTVSEIDRAAEVCRIRSVIAPYLAALAI